MYSIGYRIACMQLYRYYKSFRQTANVTDRSVSTLCRWYHNIEPFVLKRISKITDAIKNAIVVWVCSKVCKTCADVVSRIQYIFGLSASRQLVCKMLHTMGLSYKRTRKMGESLKARKLTPVFLRKLHAVLNDPNATVASVDESGFDQRASPIQGWSAVGIPPLFYFSTKSSNRFRYNLISSISNTGSSQYVLSTNTTKTESFGQFIDSLTLPAGTTLLLDNASFHTSHSIMKIMVRKGYTPLFVPPYAAPDYNPIEMMFGIIKSDFYEARYKCTFEKSNIESIIEQCVQRSLTAENSSRCFRHTSNVTRCSMYGVNHFASSRQLSKGFEGVAALNPAVHTLVVLRKLRDAGIKPAKYHRSGQEDRSCMI